LEAKWCILVYVKVVAISFVVFKGLGIVNKAFEKKVVELR
jgi:hypothetical protein